MRHADVFPPQTRSGPISGIRSPDSLCTANALSGAYTGFDPARWLSDFEAVGGGWVVRDRVLLVTRLDGQPDDDLTKARELVIGLSPAERAAIVAHLRMGGQDDGED